MLLVEDRSVYLFNSTEHGEFSVENVMKYLEAKDKRAEEGAALSRNIEAYVREGENQMSRKKAEKSKKKAQKNTLGWYLSQWVPYAIQDLHSSIYQNFIGSVFYAVGLNDMSKLVKCVLFYAWILFPVSLYILWSLFTALMDMVDPVPVTIPEDEVEKQQKMQA